MAKTINVIYKVDDRQLQQLKKSLGLSEEQSKKLSDQLKNTGDKASKAGQEGARSFMNFSDVVKAISFAALLAGLTALSRRVIETTSNFQKYEALLTNTFGSKSKAFSAFVNIQQQAAKTNFSLEEVTQGYLKLANNGIAPTNDEMTAFFDLTNNAGKTFDMFVEAVNDAVNGEFERLKEFFIKGSKDGDKITLMFKNQKFTVDNNAQSIKNLLVQLGQLNGVSGSTAAIAGTLEGQMSNFGDSIDQLLKNIGSRSSGLVAAIFELANDAVGALNNAMTDNVKYLREEQSGINLLVGAITAANVPTDVRSKLISDLNRKYPDFLRNLDAEKVTNEQLSKRLKDVNDQFFRKIALTAAEERFKDSQEEILDLIDKETELRLHLQRIQQGDITFTDDLKEGLSAEAKRALEIDIYQSQIRKTHETKLKIQQDMADQLNEYNKALNIFEDNSNDYFEVESKSTEATTKKTKAIKDAGQAVRDYLEDLSDLAMFETNNLIKANEDWRKRERENQSRSADLQEYFRELRRKKEKEAADERVKIAEDEADRKRQIEDDFYNASFTLARALVDFAFTSRESEMDQISDFYNEQIDLAGDNDRARTELETKRERALKAAREREKEEQKKQARGRIIAETAVNVVEAFPNAVLMALAASLGLVQLATVQKLRTGGWVKGPGTETSDSVPILASKNEFMVNASAAKQSPMLLEAINSKKLTDHALYGARNGGSSFNDARMVDKLSAIEKRLLENKPDDVVERHGRLMRATKRTRDHVQYVRANVMGDFI